MRNKVLGRWRSASLSVAPLSRPNCADLTAATAAFSSCTIPTSMGRDDCVQLGRAKVVPYSDREPRTYESIGDAEHITVKIVKITLITDACLIPANLPNTPTVILPLFLLRDECCVVGGHAPPGKNYILSLKFSRSVPRGSGAFNSYILRPTDGQPRSSAHPAWRPTTTTEGRGREEGWRGRTAPTTRA